MMMMMLKHNIKNKNEVFYISSLLLTYNTMRVEQHQEKKIAKYECFVFVSLNFTLIFQRSKIV
jgi:hypothetical protein